MSAGATEKSLHTHIFFLHIVTEMHFPYIFFTDPLHPMRIHPVTQSVYAAPPPHRTEAAYDAHFPAISPTTFSPSPHGFMASHHTYSSHASHPVHPVGSATTSVWASYAHQRPMLASPGTQVQSQQQQPYHHHQQQYHHQAQQQQYLQNGLHGHHQHYQVGLIHWQFISYTKSISFWD